MAATVLHGVDEVRAAVGRHLGTSEWLVVDQDRIDLFADATGDHQWIHVDAQRAAAGPFGAPVAHGYLTLSLSNYFLPQILSVEGVSAGVNYGTEKVRFPAPVKVGSRVRAAAEMVRADEVRGGGVQTTIRITIEIEGSDKPACVIESLSRWLP